MKPSLLLSALCILIGVQSRAQMMTEIKEEVNSAAVANQVPSSTNNDLEQAEGFHPGPGGGGYHGPHPGPNPGPYPGPR